MPTGRKERKEASSLNEIVSLLIQKQKDEPRISPSSIATEAMSKLRARWMNKPQEYPLVYLGCHLQLRQIARGLLREWFEPNEDANKATHPLFPELQARYPMARMEDQEPTYILLEQLAPTDWRFNVRRLRADAESRLRHASALEAWGFEKFKFATRAAVEEDETVE